MNREDWGKAQRAETLRLSKAYEQAIEIFNQLQKQYPDNAWINAHLGAIYCQLMDYRQAEEYLREAIGKNNRYSWAYAQLGETYRLRAITENEGVKNTTPYIDLAIEHFKKALNDETTENSSYAWALAHLGATYRLKLTNGIVNVLRIRSGISQQLNQETGLKQNKDEALKYLNRAIELIPTYSWAWGMRSTVYRLAQEYEASFWDLAVLTVIAPEIEVLQHSSSPVSFLESRWVNLHEHAFLAFYLTKEVKDEKKKKHYGRAIAYAQQALLVQPGDSIAKLILLVIEANQKKEMQDGAFKNSDDLDKIKKSLMQFFQSAESELFETLEKVLRYLIALGRIKQKTIEDIKTVAGEEHKLTQLVLREVIEKSDENISDKPQLWLWKNFALTQTSSSVLWLLSDLSEILSEESAIGKAEPYRELALIINPSYTIERLYQTPAVSETERPKIFNSLSQVIAL